MKRRTLSLLLAFALAFSLLSALGGPARAAGKVTCTGWWCSDGTTYITDLKLNGTNLSGSLSGLTPGETVTLEATAIQYFRCRSVAILPTAGSSELFYFKDTADPQVTAATFTVPDSDFQLRLSVESKGYVVTYMDGMTVVHRDCHDYGTTVEIRSPASMFLSKPGYTFQGWNSNQWLTGDPYAPGDTVQAEKKYARNTLHLYAVWKEDGAFAVTVERGKADKTSAKPGETVTVTADPLENYTFDHWEVVSGDVTLKDRTSAETTFVMGDQDVSLRAVRKYTGPMLTDFTVYITPPVAGEHPQAPTVKSEDYSVSAYSWVWATNEDSGKMTEEDVFREGSDILYQCRVDLSIPKYIADDADKLHGYVNDADKTDGMDVMIFRSSFAKVKVVGSFNCAPAPAGYTVTFDANGGLINGSGDPSAAVKTKPDGTIEKMPFPKREGFDFEGWFTAKTGGDKISTATVFSKDTTVYAQWKENAETPPVTPVTPVTPVNPFKDVSESDYFYEPVLWAYYAEPQVTVGISATRFGPESTVTRGQTVTFLWRAMGEPEPTITANPFVDVKESDYFYKAVLWAVENNITVGVSASYFGPGQTCSTAHIITFLYRTLGVGSNGWYEEAGAWAAEHSLLDKTGLTVDPAVNCPRAAVVTFLYRATD